MKVKWARYVLDGAYLLLEINTDLGTAIISDEMGKFRKAGFVFMGAGWEQVLGAIRIKWREAEHGEVVLRGATSDPVVLKLFDDYMAVVNSREPVKEKYVYP